MVTYLNVMAYKPFCNGLSILDIVILIVFVLLFCWGWIKYFSESKKRIVQQTSDKNIVIEGHSDMLYSPQITIVFQKDISDDEELTKEIADMYISNRLYYYSGKEPIENKKILSEKDGAYVRFNDVVFSAFASINI